MPLTPAGVAAIITPNLLSVGMLGVATPKFALGVANGICFWSPTIAVTTIDAGTAGVGVGMLPVIMPQPVLLGNLFSSFGAFGLLGVMAPLKIVGLANGISIAYLQGLIQTLHTSVGTGVGVAKFMPPPAIPQMMAGFASAGIVGQGVVQIASAIGMALMQTFTMLALPIPIVGPPSPAPSAGTGTGSIL
jgi:hypothetical protein